MRSYASWKGSRRPEEKKSAAQARAESELLKKNMNQFLRHTHPDALRRHVLRESEHVQQQYNLQGILDKNEEAIQLLNSFVQTTSNYEQHRQDFMTRGSPLKLSFYVVRRKREDVPGDLVVKEISTTTRLPNLHEEDWMRRAGSRRKECLHQWRDSALLELLLQASRVFRGFSDKKLSQCRLLPGEEQIAFLQRREAVTKVLLPPQFSKLRSKAQEKAVEEAEREQEEQQAGEESAFIDIPAGDIDSSFMRALRDDLRRSGTNRSDPTSLFSRKLGTRNQPTKEELKEILEVTKVFFPPGTPEEHVEKILKRIEVYARDLRIFEWYRLPIYVGAPTYSVTVKDGFVCLPWNFTVEGTLEFLVENLEYIQHRHLSLRNKLVEVVESCEAAKEHLEVRNIQSSQAVRHADLKRSLDRLVAAKEAEEGFVDLSGVTLSFHHQAHHYRFNEVTGNLDLPVNWTWPFLWEALKSVKMDLIAYQGNYKLLPGLPSRLLEAGIRFKAFEVDDQLKDCIVFQTHCFKRLLEQRSLFEKFDLSFLTVRISDRFQLDVKALVLSIPWDFSVDELISYLEQWQAPSDPRRQLGAGAA